jgi:hydrogenase nickel incorporation protein HypB
MKPKILQIRKGILENNDILARKLRTDFSKRNILVINVVSSPGSGKTELLTILIKKLLKKNLRVCAVVGDLATDNDAIRLKSSGAPSYQINTNGNCHLDAQMIKKSLTKVPWENTDILFIENVGNLVCPASYDLGENIRMVLMSVTEGEDKPLKYPTMFNSADVCLISKIDLSQAVEFNHQLATQNIKSVSPNIKIFETSAKKDIGFEKLVSYIISHRGQ